MSLQSKVINNIKELLSQKNMTQVVFAERLQISTQLVQKMFSEESGINLTRLQSIAEILDVRPESLITGDFSQSEGVKPVEGAIAYPEGSLPGLAHKIASKQGQIMKLQRDVTEASEKLQKMLGV